jgi:hypothetical protein
MDRFSPNHASWREQGFTRVEPMPAYRHVFPFAPEVLEALAYYFDYDHPHLARAWELGAPLIAFTERWQEVSGRGQRGELAVKPHWQGGFVLIDSRFNHPGEARRLSGEEAALLLACDAPTSPAQALEGAARAVEGSAPGLEAALARLLERGALARVGSQLITLALLPGDFRLASLERSH